MSGNTITLLPSGNGGINNDFIVYDGEILIVGAGALAQDLTVETIVDSTNTGAIVEAGGSVQGATVIGAMTVFGSVNNLVLSQDGGWVTVGAGGSIQGANFNVHASGDDIVGLSGAYIDAVTISGSLNEVIASADDTVNGTIIESGDTQEISAGSSESGTDVKRGGLDNSGGNASAVTVEGVGTEFVSGTATGGLVESKGIVDVTSGGLLESYTIAGTANVSVGGAAENPVIEGGTLNFAGNLVGTATFVGSGGTLNLIGQTGTVAIAGFTAGNTIMVQGVADPDTVTLSDTETSFVIGGITLQFPNGEGMGFTLTVDGNATAITLLNDGIYCFVAGTNILTPEGDVTVENLAIGDRVITHDGKQVEIKFIRKRSYDGRFIAGNHLALPVTVTKNAIADNVPARDLAVSPGHGMYIDKVIVPAWRLVNGVSVTQAVAVEQVHYFHVELADGHDILLAEGCPAESYLDIGTRNQFHNSADFYTRYPKDEVSPLSCAPRVESGFQLEAIQNRIAERAGIAPQERQEGVLRGFVDQASNGGVVSGWAQNIMQPEVPVILYVLVDGLPVARVLANQYRADLRSAGLGSGCHAFEFLLPHGVTGKIEVRAASGALLPLTEAAAHCPQSAARIWSVRLSGTEK